jgi:ABC-2 type transport system ATP-binding protein
MTDTILEITGLTKRFGPVVASDGVDLRVRPGEVVGLLGHNGAGKTTLVSQVVGLDAVADPATARRCVALQSQAQAPLDGMTPGQAIEIAARLRGLSRADARARTEALADELDIRDWIKRRALPDGRGISGGVRRLTSFAMAAVAPVPLVILDEPTNDVDAGRRRLLWGTVRRLADAGAGVLLVTHNIAEAESVMDEVVILDRGRVAAAGTPSRLQGGTGEELRLELALPPGSEEPSATLDPPVPFSRRTHTGRRLVLTLASPDAGAAVAWATKLRSADVIEAYTLAPITLEDAYLAAIADADSADAATTAEEPTHV